MNDTERLKNSKERTFRMFAYISMLNVTFKTSHQKKFMTKLAVMMHQTQIDGYLQTRMNKNVLLKHFCKGRHLQLLATVSAVTPTPCSYIKHSMQATTTMTGAATCLIDFLFLFFCSFQVLYCCTTKTEEELSHGKQKGRLKVFLNIKGFPIYKSSARIIQMILHNAYKLNMWCKTTIKPYFSCMLRR